VSTQLESPSLFPLPGAASPTNVVTPPRHVTLPFYWVKMSSLHPLHLPTTLRPVASPLEPKPKHWNRTTATGHPPQTARLSPSISIKMSSQPYPFSPPLNSSPLCLLPSQSTTSSELHPSSSFSFTVISCSSSLHTTTLTVTNWPTLFLFLKSMSTCEFT
jgi:hypothetical protein